MSHAEDLIACHVTSNWAFVNHVRRDIMAISAKDVHQIVQTDAIVTERALAGAPPQLIEEVNVVKSGQYVMIALN